MLAKKFLNGNEVKIIPTGMITIWKMKFVSKLVRVAPIRHSDWPISEARLSYDVQISRSHCTPPCEPPTEFFQTCKCHLYSLPDQQKLLLLPWPGPNDAKFALERDLRKIQAHVQTSNYFKCDRILRVSELQLRKVIDLEQTPLQNIIYFCCLRQARAAKFNRAHLRASSSTSFLNNLWLFSCDFTLERSGKVCSTPIYLL